MARSHGRRWSFALRPQPATSHDVPLSLPCPVCQETPPASARPEWQALACPGRDAAAHLVHAAPAVYVSPQGRVVLGTLAHPLMAGALSVPAFVRVRLCSMRSTRDVCHSNTRHRAPVLRPVRGSGLGPASAGGRPRPSPAGVPSGRRGRVRAGAALRGTASVHARREPSSPRSGCASRSPRSLHRRCASRVRCALSNPSGVRGDVV